MTNPFRKAEKRKAKLRLALAGPSGSGKTYTSLVIACRLAERLGSRVAFVDTERNSADLYADLFDFDTLPLESYHPQRYIDAIHAAEEAGYQVIVIDSLSHAWTGRDGALELVDRAAKRQQGGGNSFTAWKEITPLQNALVDAIVGSKAHMIVAMRTKTEYVMETNQHGKQVPRKVGMAPIQRADMEYEFTIFSELTQDLDMIISKTRVSSLTGEVIRKPTAALADTLLDWLDSGADEQPTPRSRPAPAARGAADSSTAPTATTGTSTPTAGANGTASGSSGERSWYARPATESQIKAIYAIARGTHAMDDGTTEEFCLNRYGVTVAELTRRQASEMVDALKLGGHFISEPKPSEAAKPLSADAFKAKAAELGFPGFPEIAQALCNYTGDDPREAIRLWRQERDAHTWEHAVNLLSAVAQAKRSQPAEDCHSLPVDAQMDLGDVAAETERVHGDPVDAPRGRRA